MALIAAGAEAESIDADDWMPSKMYLSVPLMWEILQFSSSASQFGADQGGGGGLLDASLAPVVPPLDMSESSTLEIIVATSPEITINIADGGQEAPTRPQPVMHRGGGGVVGAAGGASAGGGAVVAPNAGTHNPHHHHHHHHHQNNNSSNPAAGHSIMDQQQQADSLTFYTTPWLYADPALLVGIGDLNLPQEETGNAWWEGENLNNIMFN